MAPNMYMQRGLLGAPNMPTGLSFNLPPSLSPALAPAAPTTPAMTGLLGANPAQARAHAFLTGIGAMAPGLLAAGAPSLDPGAMAKGHALAAQGFQQGRQSALDRVRAQNVQKITMAAAAAKAARETQLHDIQMQKHAAFNKLLGIPTPAQVPTQRLASSAQSPLGANIAKAINLPSSAVKPGVWQSTTPSPVQPIAANQSQVTLGNVTVPQSVVMAASLTDDPGAELSKYVQKANDPSVEFRPGGQLTRKGQLQHEDILRKTLQKPLEFLTKLDGKRRGIKAALDQNNGLGDLAAINSYQRLIDDAVVRGEDIELITKSQSLVNYFKTVIGSAAEGRKLGKTQRLELGKAANDFISAINGSYVTRLEGVKSLAEDDGLRWKAIWHGPTIAALSGQPAANPKAPATSNNVATVPKELAKKNPNTGQASKHEPIVPSSEKFDLRHAPKKESSAVKPLVVPTPIVQNNKKSVRTPMITANGKVETVPVNRPPTSVVPESAESTIALPSGDLKLQPGTAATVSFEGLSANPNNTDTLAGLRKVANVLSDTNQFRVQLMAYAGGGGLQTSKVKRISLSRALAVRSALIEMGVRRTQIDVRALGDKTSDANKNKVDINIIPR